MTKLLEYMDDNDSSIHDAIQAMINDMFRQELDDDQIEDIVNTISLSDVLALDAAYSKGDRETVSAILGPLPQLEYNMGGGRQWRSQARSQASSRPTTSGASNRVDPASSTKPAPTGGTANKQYSGNAPSGVALTNSTDQSVDDDDEITETGNINDMDVSDDMKSLLRMRNIAMSGSRSDAERHLRPDKLAFGKQLSRTINQLKRKEAGQPSKFDILFPELVDHYNAVMLKLDDVRNFNRRETAKTEEPGIEESGVKQISIDNGQAIVTIGDHVGFKDGYEQTGRLVEILNGILILSVYDADSGERYEVQQSPDRCWSEATTDVVQMTEWLKRRAGIV